MTADDELRRALERVSHLLDLAGDGPNVVEARQVARAALAARSEPMTADDDLRRALPCGYVFGLTGAMCGRGPSDTLHRPGSYDATPSTPVHDYAPVERRGDVADRRAALAATPPAEGEGTDPILSEADAAAERELHRRWLDASEGTE